MASLQTKYPKLANRDQLYGYEFKSTPLMTEYRIDNNFNEWEISLTNEKKFQLVSTNFYQQIKKVCNLEAEKLTIMYIDKIKFYICIRKHYLI